MTEIHKNNVKYQGLSDSEVIASRATYGENLLAPVERRPWWRQFLSKFDDPIIRILMIAALIAILTGEWIEGCGILVAILLATILAFANEYSAEKEFDILNKVNDDVPVKAIRNGLIQMIPKRDIVVGDIVLIELGEEVPADGKVLEAINLQVDQSRLTGESKPVTKLSESDANALPPREETYPVFVLLRGTPVVEGHGYIQITAVGAETEIGKTAIAATEEKTEQTPLNLQLERLSKLIGVIGFAIASITFLALIVRGYCTGDIVQSHVQWGITAILLVALVIALMRIWLPVIYDGLALVKKGLKLPIWFAKSDLKSWIIIFSVCFIFLMVCFASLWITGHLPQNMKDFLSSNALPRFINYFMVAVTLIVVSVPEGLAMSVTLSLAYSMKKMTAANNLVRKMHACETIGAATVICTDKTGTLTMNQMRVHEVVFPAIDPTFVKQAMAVNSTANLSLVDPTMPVAIGNPTEGALLLWLHEEKEDYQLLRDDFVIKTQWTFSTERKFMATLGVNSEGKTLLFAKGAPEIILSRVSQVMIDDQLQPLTPSMRDNLLKSLLTYQSRGMRTLGFAYTCEPKDASDVLDVAQELIWMGFVAIADPVREDVPDAIRACYQAGIQVKMVTGDNPETAKEIGRQIALWDDSDDSKYQIMTGVEFAALSDEEVLLASKSLKIMARARPNDKLRLVRSLKSMGAIVAVTGDGTNDAPALNYSDVGISMGKTGTAIAKEASDIILLDDSFTSIVNAVMWGRSLYRNIQKFILFQLTVNVVALTIAMLGPFIGIEMPLTVIQMLWINLIMDTFAALALATDPPDPNVLKLQPRKNSAFIVTHAMWRGIFGVGFVFVATLITFLFYMKANQLSTDMRYLTLFFSVLVMMQFWNLFNAKCFGSKDSIFKHLFDNKMFVIIAVGIFILQLLVVQFGGKVFRTIPLCFIDWVYVVLGTSLIFWGGELFRLVARLREKK